MKFPSNEIVSFILVLLIGLCVVAAVNNVENVLLKENQSRISRKSSITVPEYLETISVKIENEFGRGSGVLFVRKDSTGTNMVTFVWSVAHLFSNDSTNPFPLLIPTITNSDSPVIYSLIYK